MPVTLLLAYADQGWHVRWRTPDPEAFEATREAFKATLDLYDRYWDPEAFDGRGGWWVAYGALSLVGHLFDNYQALRDELERGHWQQYEQQQREARERCMREQEREAQERETAHKQQQHERSQRQRADQQGQRQQKQAEQQAPKRESVKLPRTVDEALAALRLRRPVTASEIKRAYRSLAFASHPDHGGSHAAMVRINAAYELALAGC